jgi:arginyl-tRNA synthetase
MQTVQQQLQTAVESALNTLSIETDGVSSDALQVVPTANAQFGDYQWNGALPLAKTLKQNPRALAQQIVEKLDVEKHQRSAGNRRAGFINFRLKTDCIARMAAQALADERLGVPHASTRETFRSRFLRPQRRQADARRAHSLHHYRRCGCEAVGLRRSRGITDNHIGDWGTQFGKLIIGWKKHLDEASLQRDPISEMERLYKLVNAHSDSDPAVADEARAETAKLQSGDPENLLIWEKLRALSQQQFDEIYGRLGIDFDYTLGESFYNPRLGDIVRELKEKGIARESEGAVAVFSDGTLPPKDDPFLIQRSAEWKDNPALVQKSDGSALYATTDLATLEYRAQQWHPR